MYQPLFWLSIFTPISASIALWFPIFISYRLSFTADGYNFFLEVSRLPIAVMALSLPFGVLVGRIHGTEQTALSIAASEQEGKSRYYLSHWDHFKTQLQDLEDEINIKYESVPKKGFRINKMALYNNLYPNSSLSTGVDAVNPTIIICLVSEMKAFSTHLYKLLSAAKAGYGKTPRNIVRESIVGCMQSIENSIDLLYANEISLWRGEFEKSNVINVRYSTSILFYQESYLVFNELLNELIAFTSVQSKSDFSISINPYLDAFKKVAPLFEGDERLYGDKVLEAAKFE